MVLFVSSHATPGRVIIINMVATLGLWLLPSPPLAEKEKYALSRCRENP
jgi:hypothetical protein